MYKNLSEIELVEEAIKNREGKLGKGGSLIVFTGEKTGRSPKDKHVVREKNTEEKIWWENNRPMSPAHFNILHEDMLEYPWQDWALLAIRPLAKVQSQH